MLKSNVARFTTRIQTCLVTNKKQATMLQNMWDWIGMARCMGPMSPICAYSLYAGLCPEKLVKK